MRKNNSSKWSRKTLNINRESIREVFNFSKLDHLTYKDHLNLYIVLLRWLGLDYFDRTYYGPLPYLLGILSLSTIVYMFISEIMFIKNNIHEIDKVTEVMSTTFLACALFVKALVLIFYQSDLRYLVKNMNMVYNKAKKDDGKKWKIMKSSMKEARIVSRIIYLFCILTAFCYILIAISQFSTHRLPLLTGGYGLPTEGFSIYVFNLFIQFTCMLIATHTMTGFNSILIYFVLSLCAEIEILHLMLKDIGKNDNRYNNEIKHFMERNDEFDDIEWFLNFENTENELKKCVQTHQWVLRTSAIMNKVYKFDCLSEVVCSSMVGCVSLFQILESPESQVFLYVYIIVCTVQIFVYCWYGDQVLRMSLQICDAICQTPWYRMRPSQQKVLVIMLMKAQYPITFNGIFIELNLQCFTAVMKSTYSYYTVISSTSQ